MGLMVTTLKHNGQKYYCANCRMIQNEFKPYCAFCGYEFSNYEEIISGFDPPEIIVSSRWWEAPEEELTEEQKAILQSAINELYD